MRLDEFVDWAFGSPYYDAISHARAYEAALSPAQCAEVLTHLGADPTSLDSHSDDQLECGLRYLLYGDISDFAYLLRDGAMPLESRLRAISAIGRLLVQQLGRRLGDDLVADSTAVMTNLRSTAYMLWDVSPLSYWPPSPHAEPCRSAFIEMLGRVLTDAPSLACKESALHGLGHVRHASRHHVPKLVQSWLAARPDIPARLREYAESAAAGAIL